MLLFALALTPAIAFASRKHLSNKDIQSIKKGFSQLSIVSEVMYLGGGTLLFSACLILRISNVGAYLLVVGGDVGTESTNSVETIAIGSGVRNSECTNKSTSQFPESVIGSVGGVLNGFPTLCGGRSYDKFALFFGLDIRVYDKCWKYNFKNHSWSVSGKMDYAVNFAAGAIDSHLGLVIAGGNDANGRFTKRVTTTTDGSFFETLRDIPEATASHCLLSLNSVGDLFMTGGWNGEEKLRKTYIYRHTTGGHWEAQQDMPTARSAMGCGHVREKGTRGLIVVAGGCPFGEDSTTSRVEIFHLSTGGWRPGRNMPSSIGRGMAVPYFDTFLLIGGKNETSAVTSVLMYEGGDKESWTEEASLRTGRMDLTAFLLTWQCGEHAPRKTPPTSHTTTPFRNARSAIREISSIEIKTGTIKNAETDERIDLEINCGSRRTCFIKELDNPSKKDFQSGNTDIFSGSMIGNCQGLRCDEPPRMTLIHHGTDGWFCDNVKINFRQGGRSSSCTGHVNAWLDDPDDGDLVGCCRERRTSCGSLPGQPNKCKMMKSDF